MKDTISLVVAVIALGVGGFVFYKTVNSAPSENQTNNNSESLQIEQRLASIESKFQEFNKRLEDIKNTPAVAAAPAQRVSDDDLSAAVAKYLAEHPVESVKSVADAGSATEKAKKKAAKEAKKAEVDSLVARLLDPQLNYNDKRELFKQLKEQGLFESVLLELEKKADELKGSADVQFELGSAYIEKLQMVSDGPEKGTWAMKADSMFDKALEIDPRHWGARFSKAISLAFWPPIFGKQNDAIAQFETLRKQQEESGGTKPEFAQTYQFLGNLYQQQGKPEQAQEIWKKGLDLFPGDTGLKQKLGK